MPHSEGDKGELTLQRTASTAQREEAPVRIQFWDEHGNLTPAMLSLANANDWREVPLAQQFLPNELHRGRASSRRQWRGKFPIHSSGETVLSLPDGQYTLTAGKGLEYRREKVSFEVVAGKGVSLSVKLRRWIDLPSQGWWSGDPHVHVTRDSAKQDMAILTAAMAEDIHLTSTLQMGDANALFFSSRQTGRAANLHNGNYWLASGQEDPRTPELGHAIMLNTNRLYRDTDNYYLYGDLFAQARAEGAVTGLAHYFQAKFHTYRAGALLFPDGLVDFVELLDNSDIFRPELYYDALNLGFRIPVSAGSDYPWGDHIGDQRTYVKLRPQQTLDPQAWYEGLKAGRTFVTQGPLIQFSINDRDIGSILQVEDGEALKIRAAAQAPPYIGSPQRLWLVSMGKVVAQVSRNERDDKALTLLYSDIVKGSRWYVVVAQAHNGALAHSSPIYVIADGQPARLRGDGLQALVDKQRKILQTEGREAIPPEQRTDAYLSWLKRIESYYDSITP
tara:strand:+ start:1543 stop:3057 length:1515 start_codon:yes stop_codon:yes gene_type:complete